MLFEIYGLVDSMFGSYIVWLTLAVSTLTVFIPELLVSYNRKFKHIEENHNVGTNRNTQIQGRDDQMEGGEMSHLRPVNFSGKSESIVNEGYRTSIN